MIVRAWTGRGCGIRVALATLLAFAALAVPAAATPGDPSSEGAAVGAAMDMAQWRAERESSAARARRQRSVKAHSGLGRDGALSLARSRFPEAVGSDARHPFALPMGMEIAKLLSPETASVRSATGETLGVLQAYGPLAVERDGVLSRISLDLEPRGGGFAPRNPRAAYELPGQAADAARLEKTQIGFRMLDAAPVEGRVDNNRLFFANAGDDLDYVLSPKAAGAEALWLLRSSATPETIRLAFDLPAGAILQRAPQFGQAASDQAVEIISATDEVLATVTPPIAYAADGMGIKVQTEIEGNVLSMTVKHVGEDVMYPILLDPQVAEVWATAYGFQNCGNTVNGTGGAWTNQQYISNGGEYYYQGCDSPAHTHGSTTVQAHAYGYGLYSWQRDGGWYGAGSVAQWSWWAPADSYIQSVSWAGLRHEPAYDYTGYTNAFVAIHRDTPGGWLARYDWGHAAHWNYTQYASEASETTRAVFGISSPFTGNYWNGGMLGLEGAYIVINDRHNPSVSLAGHTPTLSGSAESPWIDPTKSAPQMRLAMTDRGLGLRSYKVVRDDGVQLTPVLDVPAVNGGICNGSRSNPCRTSYTSEWFGLTDPASLPEGRVGLHGEVSDINDRGARGPSWYLNVDRGAPVITFSGELVSERAQGLSGPSYAVRVHAADGDQSSNATRRAGVARVDVYVDDEWKAASETSSCTQTDSCGAAVDLTITDSTVADPLHGGHTITAVARDRVGNVSSQEFSFYLERPDEMRQAYLDAPPMSLTEVSNPPATEACTADPERYCGGADAPIVDEPPLIGDTFDASDEPIARAAKVQPDGWGLSDEHGEIFDIEKQQDLTLRRYRKIIDWDVATTFRKEALAKAGRTDWQFARMDKWVERAAANGVPAGDILISLSKSDSGRNRGLPRTNVEYIAAVNAIRLKWRHIATAHFAPWNEPNLGGKFSYAPYPRKAGNRFNDLRKACSQQPEGVGKCQPVAGDFADKRLTTDYVKDYTEAAGLTGETKYPWAIHLHDTGYTHDKAKWRAFRTNVKGPIWITESGAFRFQYKLNDKTKDGTDYVVGPDGVTPKNYRPRPSPGLPNDNDPEIAQMKDLKWLLDNPTAHERVERYYYYQWADHPNKEYANQDPALKYDTYGTGLVAQPNAATPRKIYCVYANRDNRTLRNNCS